MLNLDGKTVVITAGASVMAQHIARLMAGRGANLVIADINLDAAESLAAALPSAIAVECDVRSSDEVEALRSAAIDEFGAVDVVMSHAGIASAGLVTDYTDDDWRYLLDLNVIGMARLVRTFLPAMLARKSGHFIFTSSSLAVLHGHPVGVLAAPYITSKAAVVGLAQSVATAYREHGIGVTVFAPDATETGWAPAPVSGADPDELRRVMSSLPRYPRHSPQDAADVLMQALDDGSFLASATPDHARLLHLQADSALDPAALTSQYQTLD